MKQTILFAILFCCYSTTFCQVCRDTSFRKIYTSPQTGLKNFQFFATDEDSTFIAGLASSPEGISAYFSRLNTDGSVGWAKKIEFPNSFHCLPVTIGEMPDRSVLLCLTNPQDTAIRILKFSPAGNLILSKFIKGNFRMNFDYTKLQVVGNSVFLFSFPNPETGPYYGNFLNCIIKLDAALDIQWSKFYGENYSCVNSIPVGMVKNADSLIIIGRTLPAECLSQPANNLERSIYTLVLDDLTGNIRSSVNYSMIKELGENYSVAWPYYNSVIQMNGKIFFTGSLFPRIANKIGSYKLELDNNLDFINGKLYFYPGEQSDGFSRITIDQKESVNILFRNKQTSTGRMMYFGKFDSAGNKIREKKMATAPGAFSSYFGRNPIVKKSNYVKFITSFIAEGNESLQLAQLSNDENNSDCFGEDTSFIKTEPFFITKFLTPFFDHAVDLDLHSENIPVTITPLVINRENLCEQVSQCSSLILFKDPDSICNIRNEYTFYAGINDECKKHLNWTIDTSAIEYMHSIDDTTIRIKFKRTWTGKLYVSVNSCSVLKDSLELHIFDTPENVGLPADTSLCNSQSLLLQAKPGFRDYLWQDGNVNPERTVSAAGQLSIITTDYCGIFFYDTINIKYYHEQLPVNLGRDSTLCENQIYTLHAGGGFKTYQWQDMSTGESFNVSSPGEYFVRVTDSCGNIFKDTILIKYFILRPPVNLGIDFTFCYGKEYILDAGPGYKNYRWNNNSGLRVLTVNAPGIYSVTVTDSCGNTSHDEIELKPEERFSLVANFPNPICMFDSAIISFPEILNNFSCFPQHDIYFQNHRAIMYPLKTTLYNIQAFTPGGCEIADTILIKVVECAGDLYLPGAFTPDGDGKNDTYKALTEKIPQFFEMSVFNRYGQKIFRTQKITEGWDGKINGSLQNQGTFIVECRYRFRAGSMQIKKTTVILIR